MSDLREPVASTLVAGERTARGERHLRLAFVRGTAQRRAFTPLTPPRVLQADIAQLNADLLERLHLQLSAALVAGRVQVPLFRDREFPLEVPEDCRCRMALTIGRSPGAQDRPLVQSLDLSFEPALTIHHILPVLARLHTLFEDRDVAALLRRVDRVVNAPLARAGVRRLRDAFKTHVQPRLASHLPLDLPPDLGQRLRDGLREGGERLARVDLKRISAHPKAMDDGSWEIIFRFTGDIVGLDRAVVPFEDVYVPRPILPHLHAELGQLLSPAPLASGVLKSENLPGVRLLKVMAGLLSTFEGHLYLRGEPPDLDLAFLMGDHSLLQVDVAGPGAMRVRTSLRGEVAADRIHVQFGDLVVEQEDSRLSLDGEVLLTPAGPAAEGGLLGRCLTAFEDGQVLPVQAALRIDVKAGSSLPRLQGRLRHHHALMSGETDVRFTLDAVALAGALQDTFLVGGEGDPASRWARSIEMDFSAGLCVQEGSSIGDGTTTLVPESLVGSPRCHIQADERALLVEVCSDAAFRLKGKSQIDPFPELDIDDAVLLSHVEGRLDLDLRLRALETEPGLAEINFRDSKADISLDTLRLELGTRSLWLPTGTHIRAAIPAAILATTGLGQARFVVQWDMHGESPMLAHGARQVALFVPQLRQGMVTIGLGAAGRLTVSGEGDDLYDAHYFNALLNPWDEPQRWLEILEDDEALDHVLAAVSIFTPDGAEFLTKVRRFAKRMRDVLEAEGVKTPGDFLPGATMARVFSHALVKSDALAASLQPIIKQVTDGEGLDVRRLKRILDDALPEHEWGYELDRGLRWAARVFKPMDPHPPWQTRQLPPLVEELAYQELFKDLPSAGEIYRTLRAAAPLTRAFTHKLARVAPYLTLQQLDWILRQPRGDWPGEDLNRLRTVQTLKHRIQMIGDGYGGFGFAPQARAIGLFLGVAIDMSDQETPLAEVNPLVADVLLGPADIAVLLQAGLAAPLQGRVNQLNQRMLLDLVLNKPPEFLRQVLLELGAGGPRVLAAVLNALLELEQGLMRRRLDLVTAFHSRLDIEFPRLTDYLAGGRWARMSYYEALNKTAEQVLGQGQPYEALKAWLQVERHEPPMAASPSLGRTGAARAARRAVEEADRLAKGCRFDGSDPEGCQAARRAYGDAFAACRGLLAVAPKALELPWMKEFWARNYEALMVLSVVRNAQQDVDEVRRWLAVRTGQPVPDQEQRLVEAVIDGLYYWRKERDLLKRDPLVRLLMDPPAGRYDFTIVSCMGVVTDGEKGLELDSAYRRLEAQRGIRVVRANTANVRSLEYNAARVVEAVQKVTTPWGIIGYSQGCANALMAEARMRGGTPEQQALLDGFCGRNFLFSAINGSAHGTFGDEKFLQAMVMGDSFLAQYQATMSHQATRFALRGIRLMLDSPGLILGLRGASSLSLDGVIPLARDGQWKDGVATCIMRGIVEPETLPEALELLSHSLTVQVESSRHDTQVEVHEALGHPIWVKNAWTEVLERQDMGCLVQATHHWSPLDETTEFITTQRDRVRAIYKFPKDRHVFPWIEVNARFGVIEPSRDGE